MLNVLSGEAIKKISERADAVVYGVYGNESSDFWHKAEALLLQSLVVYIELNNLVGDSDVDLIVKIQEVISNLESEEYKIKETFERYPGNLLNLYMAWENNEQRVKNSIISGLHIRLDKILNDLKESSSLPPTLVIGPAGSGKTLRFVIPNILLEKKRSILVFDPRKEIAAYTKNQKAKQGYNIEYLDLDEKNDFTKTVQKFVEEKTVLYIHMQSLLSEELNENTLESIANLFKNLLEEISTLNRKANKDQFNGTCIFLENATLYKVKYLPEILAVARGYNTHITIIIQSINELEKLYGLETSRSILTNCNTKLIMGITNQRDAEYFSELLGEKAIEVEQNKYVKRKHLSKDELLGLNSEQAILLQSGEQFRIIDKLPFEYGTESNEG
ncbi:type IV secretory system conjugative DNA transfer family protein [Bacillus mobilis]|uniref:type IV secretory system conjugative DNA transfer family protein n=1 Tax=Bacillus mobilis TaxID=2026190 RepID=UPI002E1B0733|nr:type IV secretory system conjugative DNA transfer family protein [Bacillus mobilis]